MKFIWKKNKNSFLKKQRGISFELICDKIIKQKYLDIIRNPNYENQEIFVFKIENYIWAVPFEESSPGTIELKTAYKSRKLNKLYGGEYE
ncbi:MAG: toxin [Thermodesulfobacteriota bacterium]